MAFSNVLPIWLAVQERFIKTVKALSDQDLSLQMGSSSIGSLIRHNAEVEFMFAEWFFGRSIPEDIKNTMSRGAGENNSSPSNVEELVALLTASNANLIEAMRELSEAAWHERVESSIGGSTPLEAIGRLIYHTGIHAGQISLIQKNSQAV